MQEIMNISFQYYGKPLEMVTLFKYLVRVLTTGYEDCLEVVGNLRKAQKSWVSLTRILVQDRKDPRVSGIFFKAVVQAVFIFGPET